MEQALGRHAVRLVQHDAHLARVLAQQLDHLHGGGAGARASWTTCTGVGLGLGLGLQGWGWGMRRSWRGCAGCAGAGQPPRHLSELVADVGLVRVEEEEDAVRVLREPADDRLVVVAATPLLLTW